jgi:hypothetical protein
MIGVAGHAGDPHNPRTSSRRTQTGTSRKVGRDQGRRVGGTNNPGRDQEPGSKNVSAKPLPDDSTAAPLRPACHTEISVRPATKSAERREHDIRTT